MFNLKTKDKYEKILFWKNFIFKLLSMCLMICLLFLFLTFFNLGVAIDVYILNFMIIFIWLMSASIIDRILSLIVQFMCRKKSTIELLEILKDTKLPNNLPKVVYVYTTHNDFWEARLLQSMRQTYPNIEYWISDGSSNNQKSKNVKEFAIKHNINYHSLNRPSIHKADNLNHFLKHSGATFDYLLIGDSDAIIDPNFVCSSLKFFYFKNQYNLGWVSSFTQAYKGNNLFNNVLYNIENVGYFDILNKNYQSSIQVNLFSSTALLKREMLEEFDMQFPDSCLEDGWLEFFATKKNWTGLVNPFVTSLESFDKDIKIMFKRNFRISDWGIKLVKEDLFRAQNEMKKTFYLGMFKSITSSLYQYFLSPILLALKIFILVNFWQTIFQHHEYIIIFSFLIASFFVSLFIKIAKNLPILGMKIFPFLFFNKILTTSMFWYSGIRFFNAFFRSKYATFETSRENKTSKNTSFLNMFILISLIIISFEVPFVLFRIYEKNLLLSFIFIFLNVVFGWIWISLFCFYFLYFLSFIKTNRKYNENDFVYCHNEYVQQKEIINKWCIKNNLNFDEILRSH